MDNVSRAKSHRSGPFVGSVEVLLLSPSHRLSANDDCGPGDEPVGVPHTAEKNFCVKC